MSKGNLITTSLFIVKRVSKTILIFKCYSKIHVLQVKVKPEIKPKTIYHLFPV